jgi:hypothetical protein
MLLIFVKTMYPWLLHDSLVMLYPIALWDEACHKAPENVQTLTPKEEK